MADQQQQQQAPVSDEPEQQTTADQTDNTTTEASTHADEEAAAAKKEEEEAAAAKKKEEEEAAAAKKEEEEAAAAKKKEEEEAAAAKKKEEEAAAAKKKEEDAEIQALEERLAAIEKERDEAKRRKTDADTAAKDHSFPPEEESRKDLAAVKKEHDGLKEERKKISEELLAIAPEYDRAAANPELRERLDKCNRDIAEKEKELEKQNEKHTAAEADLERVSAQYNRTRDLRATFVQRTTEVLESLREQVGEKIANTMEGDEVTNTNPFELIELLGDLVLSREREVHNNTRLLRELAATIELKKATAEKLESETAGAVEEKKRERAEIVKRLVYSFQEERNLLQADIEEVRRVNNEQSRSLVRGHVSKRPTDPQVFKSLKEELTPSGRKKPVQRATTFRKDAGPGENARMIEQQNTELEKDLNETLASVSAASREKTELVKTQKNVKHQITVDKHENTLKLRDLEVHVVAEVDRVRKLTVENARLADAVKYLTDTVRGTKERVERVRCHTAPLPIEEE